MSIFHWVLLQSHEARRKVTQQDKARRRCREYLIFSENRFLTELLCLWSNFEEYLNSVLMNANHQNSIHQNVSQQKWYQWLQWASHHDVILIQLIWHSHKTIFWTMPLSKKEYWWWLQQKSLNMCSGIIHTHKQFFTDGVIFSRGNDNERDDGRYLKYWLRWRSLEFCQTMRPEK